MTDAIATFFVIAALGVITAFVALAQDRAMRAWVWLGLAEYLFCGGAQLVWMRLIVEGGDATAYTHRGVELVRFLDANFRWAAPEMISMLLQRPCAFDILIETPESNTGSMFAVATFAIFILRSEVAAQICVAGLSFLGALSIFTACRDAYPEGKPVHLFATTVLFPSIAFWTSAMHKESFCVMGIGLLLSAWRAIAHRKFRAFLYAPLGLAMILLFRAPALPPVVLGLAVYVVLARLQKVRGADVAIVGPAYFAVALGAVALAMLAATQAMPGLRLSTLSDTLVHRQEGWAQSAGGSHIGEDTAEGALPQSLAGQLVRLPVGLLNALFRPMFFDVHNVATLLAAIEMTVIVWLVIRAIRNHGLRGLAARIQRSPFLLMCTVITIVGCGFVGLVTLNLGSLARYRVPFLPFYGALVLSLSVLRGGAIAPEAMKPTLTARGRGRASRRLHGRSQRTT